MTTYYIYEVPGHKNGATKRWEQRSQYNFETYGVQPIVIETMEGPDDETMWQIVGDREWELADQNGYPRGDHYKDVCIKGGIGGAARAQQESFKNINNCISNETRSRGGAIGGRTRAENAKIPGSRAYFAHLERSSKGGIAFRGYKYDKITCPYCNKSGGGGNMKRYHFDNCKHKKSL